MPRSPRWQESDNASSSGSPLNFLILIAFIAIAGIFVYFNFIKVPYPVPIIEPTAGPIEPTDEPEVTIKPSIPAYSGPPTQSFKEFEYIVGAATLGISKKLVVKDGVHEETLTITNKGDKPASFSILEVIPKQLKADSSGIIHSVEAKLVLDDPAFLIPFVLDPGESKTIITSLKSNADLLILHIPVTDKVAKSQPELIEKLAQGVGNGFFEDSGWITRTVILKKEDVPLVETEFARIINNEDLDIDQKIELLNNFIYDERRFGFVQEGLFASYIIKGSVDELVPVFTYDFTMTGPYDSEILVKESNDIRSMSPPVIGKPESKNGIFYYPISVTMNWWDDDVGYSIWTGGASGILGLEFVTGTLTVGFGRTLGNKIELPVNIKMEHGDYVNAFPQNLSIIGNFLKKPLLLINNLPYPVQTSQLNLTTLFVLKSSRQLFPLDDEARLKELASKDTVRAGASLRGYLNRIMSVSNDGYHSKKEIVTKAWREIESELTVNDVLASPLTVSDYPARVESAYDCSSRYCDCNQTNIAIGLFASEVKEKALQIYDFKYNEYAYLIKDVYGANENITFAQSLLLLYYDENDEGDGCEVSALNSKIRNGNGYIYSFEANFGKPAIINGTLDVPVAEKILDLNMQWRYYSLLGFGLPEYTEELENEDTFRRLVDLRKEYEAMKLARK